MDYRRKEEAEVRRKWQKKYRYKNRNAKTKVFDDSKIDLKNTSIRIRLRISLKSI